MKREVTLIKCRRIRQMNEPNVKIFNFLVLCSSHIMRLYKLMIHFYYYLANNEKEGREREARKFNTIHL